MKINDSQQSKSKNTISGRLRSESSRDENGSSHPTSPQVENADTSMHSSRRQIRILLSIAIVILSTLWVQITMQRHAPFIRTSQSYFNEIVLEHYSQDIYEGTDVIYWKTGEYYQYQDILDVFRRLNKTVTELNINSLYQLSSTFSQEEYNVKMLAKYGDPKLRKITEIQSYNATLSDLPILIEATLMNRKFYEHLWQLQLSIAVPILYRQSECFLSIKLTSELSSSFLMAFNLNVDILNNKKGLVKGEDEGQVGTRKLHDPFDMQLSIPQLFWIIVALFLILFALEFKFIVMRNREVTHLLRKKIKQQKKIQKLLQQMNKSEDNLQQLKVNDSSNESKEEQKINLEDDHFRIPEKYQLTIVKRVQRIGVYYVAEFVLSFISLITCYNSHNGIICFFAWIKLMVYLTQTKNRYMVGFLLEQAMPIYLKVLLNIFLLMTAFVLFNTLVYPTTRKFQTLELGYFQYIFNYFQYGIYQNFILAFKQYGLMAQFFYFLQLLYLLYIGNNILQSVLANQVMKNSYVDTVKELIDDLKADCPACGADPKDQVKQSEEFLSEVPKKKAQFLSKIIKHDHLTSQMQSHDSRDSYHIVVNSPLLSPFFPSNIQRKQSQKFMSPKLKGGKFEKRLKEIKKKVEQDQITNINQIQEINKLNTKYELKTLKLQISQSNIEEKAEDKYLKKLKSKMEILMRKIERFNEIDKEATSRRSVFDKNLQMEVKLQVLKGLLQRIERLKQSLSKSTQ